MPRILAAVAAMMEAEMNPTKGYYSLIQYCPDFSRAESANIGVLLFCPDKKFIDARTSSGNDRVSRFFGQGTFDPKRINEVKQAIKDRLRSREHPIENLEDLKEFIGRRANEIVISDLRSLKVRNPDEDLERLFNELVGGRKSREKKEKILFPTLDEAFRGKRFQGRITTDYSVDIPILGTSFKAEYSFRNGVDNLVKPTAFSKHKDAIQKEASRLAICGDMLKNRKASDSRERQLIVIPQLPDDVDPDQIIGIESLLREYQTRLVKPTDLDAFIEEVDRVAHAQGLAQ